MTAEAVGHYGAIDEDPAYAAERMPEHAENPTDTVQRNDTTRLELSSRCRAALAVTDEAQYTHDLIATLT